MFKYMFNIKLNNKCFAIFLGDDGHKAFLEVKNTKLFYPEYKDYLLLNNVYNKKKSFISYEIHKLNFEEKALLKNTAVAVALLATVTASITKDIVKKPEKVNEEKPALVEEEPTHSIAPFYTEELNIPEEKKITSNAELTNVLGYESISYENLIEAINACESFDIDDKARAITLVNTLYNNFTDYDFRLFYENLKSIKIEKLSDKEFLSSIGKVVLGYYDVKENKICYPINASENTRYHELLHSTQNIYYKTDKANYYRFPYSCEALGEAMNAKITNLIVRDNSYKDYQSVLDFLCSIVGYSISDYSINGIDGLLSSLKKAYPTIDIEFIANVLDSLYTTKRDFGVNMTFDKAPSLMEELFKIVKQSVNINSDNVYEPFESFSQIFLYLNDNSSLTKYLKDYNEYLASLGYENVISYNDIAGKVNNFKGESEFCYFNGLFCPAHNENGNEFVSAPSGNKEISLEDYFTLKINFDSDNFIVYAFMNIHSYNEDGFMSQIIADTKEVSPHLYKPIPIFYQGKYINDVMIDSFITISIGYNEEGKVGAKLFKDNEVIFFTDENLSSEKEVPLTIYLNCFDSYLDKLDLSLILNNDYLNLFLSKNDLSMSK